MTSRQELLTVDGFTHASNVIADVRRRDAASGMVTMPLPSNDRAPPKRPEVVRETPDPVAPLLLLPDASVVAVPLASSNPYAATSPDPLAATARRGVALSAETRFGLDDVSVHP